VFQFRPDGGTSDYLFSGMMLSAIRCPIVQALDQTNPNAGSLGPFLKKSDTRLRREQQPGCRTCGTPKTHVQAVWWVRCPGLLPFGLPVSGLKQQQRQHVSFCRVQYRKLVADVLSHHGIAVSEQKYLHWIKGRDYLSILDPPRARVGQGCGMKKVKSEEKERVLFQKCRRLKQSHRSKMQKADIMTKKVTIIKQQGTKKKKRGFLVYLTRGSPGIGNKWGSRGVGLLQCTVRNV
jgi:hypothetical protein